MLNFAGNNDCIFRRWHIAINSGCAWRPVLLQCELIFECAANHSPAGRFFRRRFVSQRPIRISLFIQDLDLLLRRAQLRQLKFCVWIVTKSAASRTATDATRTKTENRNAIWRPGRAQHLGPKTRLGLRLLPRKRATSPCSNLRVAGCSSAGAPACSCRFLA